MHESSRVLAWGRGQVRRRGQARRRGHFRLPGPPLEGRWLANQWIHLSKPDETGYREESKWGAPRGSEVETGQRG